MAKVPMRALHCIWLLVAVLAGTAQAQAPAATTTSAKYALFLRGVPVGEEEISVRAGADGTVATGRGMAGSPINTIVRNVEIAYGPKDQAQSFVLDGLVNGVNVSLRTTVKGESAVTEGTVNGKPHSTIHPYTPGAVLVPSGVFTSFAALAPRLHRMRVFDEFTALAVPDRDIKGRIANVFDERMQLGTALIDVRRYELSFVEPSGEVLVHVTLGAQGNLIRVNVPGQGLDLVRSDLAGAVARTDVYSNPGDQAVMIPSAGFNLGATITIPSATAPGAGGTPPRRAAVILLAGFDAPDRDSIAPGTPVLGQLAGSLADSGYIAVRFDRRGSAQSGGRSESATLSDYADDVRTVAKWLADRKDVDPRRIAVIGHDQGAWIGLLAASRDNRIAAVAALAAPSTSGADVALEQQQLQLDRMKATPDVREAKVALQKQIHSAVLTGRDWSAIPPELRRQADTPYFQSFLAFDPAKVVDGIDAPVLVVHGELDREVPVSHAEKLAKFAQDGDSKSVELVTARGVNHRLLPAFTGEIGEYESLPDRTVSKDVVAATLGFLGRAIPPARAR